MKGYWDGILRSRISRRRSLGLMGTAVGTAAALSLIGCGDDDDSGSTGGTGGSSTGGGGASTGGATGGASLLQSPADTTSSAVQGGNFNHRVGANSLFEQYGFDQNLNGSGNPGRGGWVYSHFVKAITGTHDANPTGEVEGDFAESFEVAPDGLKVTFHVRPGIVWDQRPPTSGRTADSADMAFSYERWAAENPRRSFLANDVNPDAPVVSWSSPDDMTFVMDLKFPFAPMMPLMAVNPFPLVTPVELLDLENTQSTARGSAAWIEDEYQEANFTRFRRNPDWYVEDRPFLETYTIHVVPDYAAGLAQFKTGALDTFDVTQEDILPTLEDVPGLVLSQEAKWRNNPTGWLFFGFREGSPFRDDRVRKAMSMVEDRDTFLTVFSGKEEFEAAGIPQDYVWYNFLGAGYPDTWLDPQGSELGESSKYYQFDPAEAKKMVEAAGFETPLEVVWHVPDVNHGDATEAVRGGIQGTGVFNLETVDVLTYRPDFNDQIRESKGDFDGMAYVGWGNNADPDHTLYGIFHPSSAPNWQIGLGEDPELTRMLEAQRSAIDRTDRVQVLKDLQRYLSENMFCVPGTGNYRNFTLHQPWVLNFDYHVAPITDPAWANLSQLGFTYQWIDESKRPS